MSRVAGEDTESDEEINTDEGYVPPAVAPNDKKSAFVPGEGSETDEEEEKETDGRIASAGEVEKSISPAVSKGSLDSGQGTTAPPSSLLHKRLRESNVSLRRNITDRILQMYQILCRNLTLINDNLSKSQALVEKVTAHMKNSCTNLTELNSALDDISKAMQTAAPNIKMNIAPPPTARTQPAKAPPAKAAIPQEEQAVAASK
eukprot:Em0023g751a